MLFTISSEIILGACLPGIKAVQMTMSFFSTETFNNSACFFLKSFFLLHFLMQE